MSRSQFFFWAEKPRMRPYFSWTFSAAFQADELIPELRSAYHDLGSHFSVNRVSVSDSAREDPLRATISV